MWDRGKLKESAKLVLGKNIFGKKWLMSALASLLYTFFTGLPARILFAPISGIPVIALLVPIVTVGGINNSVASGSAVAEILSMPLVIYSITVVIMIIISPILTAPLQVGFIRYFLALRDPYDSEAPSLKLIFSCFKKGQYMNVVKSWGITLLLIDLWMFVPYAGIVIYTIKHLKYFYVPYVVADNPDIDRKTATTVSSQMTDSERTGIFVMEMSFIGWMLLGLIIAVFDIPVVAQWVTPYVQTTYANLYDFAKRRAIGRGMYSPELFGIYPQGDPQDPYAQPFDINAFYTRNRNYSRGCI